MRNIKNGGEDRSWSINSAPVPLYSTIRLWPFTLGGCAPWEVVHRLYSCSMVLKLMEVEDGGSCARRQWCCWCCRHCTAVAVVMVVVLDDNGVDDDVCVGVGAFVCGEWRVLPTGSAKSSGPWPLAALAESLSFSLWWLCYCCCFVVVVVIGFRGCWHPARCVVVVLGPWTMMFFRRVASEMTKLMVVRNDPHGRRLRCLPVAVGSVGGLVYL